MERKTPSKRSIIECLDDSDEKVYKFRILLPNGTTTELTLREPGEMIYVHEFIDAVKHEYFRNTKTTETSKPRRKILWKSKSIYLEDVFENKFRKQIYFKNFKPFKCHILKFHDGAEDIADRFENMWDLTPDTDLLMELPEEYTFETALADLIDNSLQAIWSNSPDERRLIRVTIDKRGIAIFDTGPGMDGSDENSIVKWGKMGASLHRSSRGQAIGGKPPYLTPFFGMFGYGGPIASMHLGRCALVSSKTKESKKVYTLHLERDALLSSSGSEQTWRTDGGLRDPFDDELSQSPHGSFTKVEIFEPKIRSLDVFQLQCKLKDIYFPYIQVNDVDLTEVEGGEVATTNLHSCNGPEFVIQLHFSMNQFTSAKKSPGSRLCQEANARLKCVYFPIIEGKESFDRILEELDASGCRIMENFDNFCRVSIRRLGRLLPDARWGILPFMEPRQKKGYRAQLLKRCCLRVKCFVETDSGFSPTPSKTDLAHHHPYTTALKNFGQKYPEKEDETFIEISRGGKLLSLSQLEKEYHDWVMQMHDRYDKEDCGDDEATYVLNPCNKKGLAISSDVLRVHKAIWRKGTIWRSGQKVKILKGAVGCHKNNIYATLEYILIEESEGDVGGEARLICRPLGVPDERGCLLLKNAENSTLDIRGSLSFPISVIDSGKFQAIDIDEWNLQLEKQRQKAPAVIDVLNVEQCQQLEIDGALPFNASVHAGHAVPPQITAVIRPESFISSSTPKALDQKHIFRGDLEMCMEIKFSKDNTKCGGDHIYAERVKPSSCKGFHGLYIFSLGCKFPELFQRAGVYMFSFSAVCTDSSIKVYEKSLLVKPSSEVGNWGLISDVQKLSYCVRVGSCLPPVSVACYDIYNNRMPFPCIPELMVKLEMKRDMIVHVNKMIVGLSSDKMTMDVKNILIKTRDLDWIRPNYKATLVISSQDELLSVAIPCQVTPGPLSHVKDWSPNLKKNLLPGDVLEKLLLEMLDDYGNHLQEGDEILLNVDGLSVQYNKGSVYKVDDRGYLNLSGLLKVTGSYGKTVSLSVFLNEKMLFKKEFQVEKRELRIASKVPDYCAAGGQLENIMFEVVDSEGVVDQTIHDDVKCGQSHTLTIKSESSGIDDTVRYTFQHGRCTIPFIIVPHEQGIFRLLAAHSHHPELHQNIEVHVTKTPKPEHDDVAQSQYSDEKTLFPRDSSPYDMHMVSIVETIINQEKDLEGNVCNIGSRVGDHERKLKMLNEKKESTEQDIYNLEALMAPQLLSQLDNVLNEKEIIVKRIERKVGTAAAVLCNFSKAVQLQEPQDYFKQDMVGVVALLGTVDSNDLSRIFAEYLGEENMLAVVCKSYAAASSLEKYEKNGKIDPEHALHATAAALGKSINGRFLVICLEDIRPYSGKFVANDPQRKLALSEPLLPSGNIAPGFLGYAVNMINLDIHHLKTRTAKGHGLRETLFYLLFGELHVYDTRDHMIHARAYAKHGAVSLDGGIMKGSGVISLGYCEPEVCFPVITEVQTCFPPHTMEILKQIEDKRLALEVTRDEIVKESMAHAEALKKFGKKSRKYREFMEEMGPFIGYYLEYNLNKDGN
ncbi:PREDICTED: uncharacterized protein LOC104604778 isoform X2 [Nelumbo nucifera]|uniref:Uncharacterized protein LOC104604778 isoform X2 n=1 Tax=Nelumbo nucifera TaxID=4432 RepID=A0A1U8AWD9_NELNU|nr:PREDICTED: uncharacterized protein LOC104604778 isoform X2 [Nelumbo nucifera]